MNFLHTFIIGIFHARVVVILHILTIVTLCILTNAILLKFISIHEHMTVHLCVKIISIDVTKEKKLFGAEVLKNLALTWFISTAQKKEIFHQVYIQ